MTIHIHKKPRLGISRFLLWALVFLIVFSLLLDGLGSTILAQISPQESLGINPSPTGSNFEVKLYLLKGYVAKNGGVDILLIGSSVVNTGLDPDVVAQTLFDLTGKKLRIFNFGVEGLDIVPNSVYAKILVKEFHPALLIFGTIPRDYLASDNADLNAAFLASPWIRYQSGEWNFPGWLIANAAALRHYLPYRNWMRSDFFTIRSIYFYRISRTSASGYEPDHAIVTNLDIPPDPNDPSEIEAFAKYRDYKVDPSRLASLEAILSLQGQGSTRVIVMNLPLEPTFYDYMGGTSVYQQYLRVIETAVVNAGGQFISSNDAPQIPPDGRPDREHLNHIGAPVLSVYLGERLAALAKADGTLFAGTGQGSH
jgi:hypothetical protein